MNKYQFDFSTMNMEEYSQLETLFQTLQTLQDIKTHFVLFSMNIRKFSKTDLKEIPFYDIELFIKCAKNAFYQETDPAGHIASQAFNKE